MCCLEIPKRNKEFSDYANQPFTLYFRIIFATLRLEGTKNIFSLQVVIEIINFKFRFRLRKHLHYRNWDEQSAYVHKNAMGWESVRYLSSIYFYRFE